MALEPILWALHDSPVNSTIDRMLLAGLAEKADPDGTNAFPSRRTLARIALCDVKTVQQRLAALTERGVITLGKPGSRPVHPGTRPPQGLRPADPRILVRPATAGTGQRGPGTPRPAPTDTPLPPPALPCPAPHRAQRQRQATTPGRGLSVPSPTSC
ncbi:helix-turn-helix domain-containing protein [Streptomyces lavendulae]|uniref:helix-turn-helix domain-containing protein n=1 Tax=Streptomyces lavendulae TaxID=1914 RepID=UPI0037FCD9A1